MNTQELILKVSKLAKDEAEKDLAFSGAAPLAGLPETSKRALVNALIYYAETGAVRAIRFAEKNGCLKID